MTDDSELSRRFHAAFDVEPDPGSFYRLKGRLTMPRAALSRRDGYFEELSLPVRLAAVAAVGAVALASVALALNGTGLHRTSPGSATSCLTPGPNGGFAEDRPTSGDGLSAFSSTDAAIWTPCSAFVTHDGGGSWLPITGLAEPNVIQDLKWFDRDHLLVIGGGTILTSVDGGRSWISDRASIPPRGTFFLNERQGWAHDCTRSADGREESCTDTSIVATSDGGVTWIPIPLSQPLPAPVADSMGSQFYFLDAQRGLSLDTDGVFFTNDGGSTWTAAKLTPPPVTAVPGQLVVHTPLKFGSVLILPVRAQVDASSPGTVTFAYTSTDGGASWSDPRSAPGESLSATNATDWWSLDNGRVYRTLDGGLSWQQVHVDLSNVPLAFSISSIQPEQDGVVWGLTDGSQPIRSEDDGLTWHPISLP